MSTVEIVLQYCGWNTILQFKLCFNQFVFFVLWEGISSKTSFSCKHTHTQSKLLNYDYIVICVISQLTGCLKVPYGVSTVNTQLGLHSTFLTKINCASLRPNKHVQCFSIHHKTISMAFFLFWDLHFLHQLVVLSCFMPHNHDTDLINTLLPPAVMFNTFLYSTTSGRKLHRVPLKTKWKSQNKVNITLMT